MGHFITCRYSISSPVSSFSTALRISTGKRRLARLLGDTWNWLIVAQNNIASCATEQKLGFLLRVIWAGPSSREYVAFVAKRGYLLGGSTFGSVGMGWLILMCLISVVDRLSGYNHGAMRLDFTLGESTGRGVGSVAGDCVGGRSLSSMWSFCCKEGWCVALSRGLGVVERKDSEAAA